MGNFFTDNERLKFHLHNDMMKEIIRLKERDYADKDKYDFAPESYEDAIDSYEKVLEIVGEITSDVLAENAKDVDIEGPKIEDNAIVYAKGTQRNHEALRDAGLYGMSLPRQYGGLNFSYVPYVMAAEIVSRGDCGFANIWGLQDCAETIYEFGSEEIKNEYLPRINKGATCSMDLTEPDAGSDLQAVRLKATYDEQAGVWRLNGVKRFITNGDADIKLVLARSEEGTTDGRGLSYFVYDRNNKAVTVRRIENKLGIKGSPTAELVFNNAPAQIVGDRKLGLIKYVMSLMNGARLGVGAQSVGLAEAAYREAVKYAHEREQFGKPIANFAQVYEMLGNMRAKTDAIRTLLYETARQVDMYKSLDAISRERKLAVEEKQLLKAHLRLADALTPMLKLFASEYANQITYDCIQVHGGSGFMKDYACERMYRDARILTIYEGTSQLQVVAAIKGVTSGIYAARIKEYEAVEVSGELATMRQELIKMRERYESILEKAKELGTASEAFDFVSRRLVEMAGYLIMTNLLVNDAARNDIFTRSARIMTALSKSEIEKAAVYIDNFNPDILEDYKSLL
ncbi:MAG: acyl-CoA dehydrogenase family protein [Candidatus Onthomorpha sp.]|nr:acyl-CoA dehydrogenase family protein [Bacteroidales bacterium]MDY4584005.1 acyl-CoA dehydrogenase family protein [Candidatus Onthomorpha sp.]MCI6645302.1 acyl-CoA dehydrogenase family protein [Bacteroidales bacterium]MCI6901117.1 acyl-CoA dehydrogenase family protein [Bacteroidales bacterium]MCI7466443.1 acyl-CoA dehydrogenase family protein [Bacteroidales bacterium]